MNEAGYPRFTKYMATGYSMGQLCWGIPVVNFQTDIAVAGRVENEHRLPKYASNIGSKGLLLFVYTSRTRLSVRTLRSAVHGRIASK